MPFRVAVIGAGISGLSAAFELTQRHPDAEVVVLERGSRPGGLIKTDWIDGFLVEQGPDSILTEKPQALNLAHRLELDGELLSTNSVDRGAYVLANGRLRRIPEGFSMMAPSQALPILGSSILSWKGKMRMAAELLLPRGPVVDDESVADFVGRRFGHEVLERLAQPLMSGIYGTDPRQLSLRSTMPRFIEMEKDHRSVTLGMLHKRKNAAGNAKGVRYGLFVSFKRGNQTLIDALSTRLGSKIQLGVEVTSIRRVEPTGYQLALSDREPLNVDGVVLAIPARIAAPIVRRLDAPLSDVLGEIQFGSTATVAYGFKREAIRHPFDAFGFVVPTTEQRQILASTWASKKFAGRAPEGHALIRTFFGGDHDPRTLTLSDDDLVELGKKELDALLGIDQAPLFASVGRQPHAMPKYTVGHANRVARCEARLSTLPALAIAGNSLYGVGIPDAIGAGERAAVRVADTLLGRA